MNSNKICPQSISEVIQNIEKINRGIYLFLYK